MADTIQQLKEGNIRFTVTAQALLVAKIKSVISGKRIKDVKKVSGQKAYEFTRPMSISDYFTALAEKDLADVSPGVREMIWLGKRLEQAASLRAREDAKRAAGVDRIPPELHKTRGRVAGKKYANYPTKKA